MTDAKEAAERIAERIKTAISCAAAQPGREYGSVVMSVADLQWLANLLSQLGDEEVRKYLDEARDKFHVLGCNFSEASPERVCAFGLRDEAASLLERLSKVQP